jgi:hypothetical protein
MATVPTIPEIPAGSVATATQMNDLAYAMTFFLQDKPLAQAKASSGQSVTGSTQNIVALGTKVFDNDGMWSSSFNGLTVQTQGWYRFSYGIPCPVITDGHIFITTGTNNPAGSGVTSTYWPGTEGHSPSANYIVCRASGIIPQYMYALDEVQVECNPASSTTLSSGDWTAFLSLEWVAA